MQTKPTKARDINPILSLVDVAKQLEVKPGYLKNALNRYPWREKAYKRVEQFKSNGGVRVLHKLASSKEGKGHTPVRNLQYLAYHWLQGNYEPSISCHGFVKGRSVVSNAQVHTGKKLIIKTDIKDFFPSIHFGRVRGMFTKHPFKFGLQAASTLARICCLPVSEGGALPQGGITSPYVANMICRKLDFRLMKLAESRRMVYSRYADDLTFSTNAHVDVEDFLAQVEQVVSDEGFQINQDKTRVMKPSDRQVVTGIILNEGLNVNRRYLKRLRAILHNMEQNGVEDTCHKAAHWQQKASFDARQLHLDQKNPDHFLIQIKGQVEWVNQVLRPYKSVPQVNLRKRAERAHTMLEQVTRIGDVHSKTNSSFYLLQRAYQASQEKHGSPWQRLSKDELIEEVRRTGQSDPRFLFLAQQSFSLDDKDYEDWAKKCKGKARFPAYDCDRAAALLAGLKNSETELLGRIVHQQETLISVDDIETFLRHHFFPTRDVLPKPLNDSIADLIRLALFKAESNESRSYDYWNDDRFKNSYILPFKQRFRLSTHSKDDTGTSYLDYFQQLAKADLTKRELELKKLKSALYCDTHQLKEGLECIFKSMNYHARSEQVVISFRIDDKHNSILIHDVNADPLDVAPSRDALAHGKLLKAISKLNGCCNYFIMANFAEHGWLRINMMDATQKPEPCDPQSGFTHQLRFLRI
jgi:retron-type reverse transcriptase